MKYYLIQKELGWHIGTTEAKSQEEAEAEFQQAFTKSFPNSYVTTQLPQ